MTIYNIIKAKEKEALTDAQKQVTRQPQTYYLTREGNRKMTNKTIACIKRAQQ